MELTHTLPNINKYSHFFEYAAKLFTILSIIALPLSTTFTDVLLIMAIMTTIVAGNIQEKIAMILENPVAWLFISFYGLFVIGSFYSVAPIHDISKTLVKNTKLLYGALLIPIFVEQRTKTLAINALLAVMTMIMVLSYAKAFGWIHLTERYQDAAVFKSHIQTNFMMAIYAYMLADRAIVDTQWRKLWLALFVLATINAFFISEGRTGYIVFSALILLFGWQHWRLRGVLIAMICTVLLVSSAMFCSTTFQDRFTQVVSDSQKYNNGDVNPTSTGLRISFYENALKIMKANPIFGSGTGSVITRYLEIEPKIRFQTHNPHNEYFNVGIQLGVVGVAFLLFFFGRIGWCSFTLENPWQNIVQASVVAVALGCTLNSWLLDTLQGHFFAIMIAMCFAKIRNGARLSAS